VVSVSDFTQPQTGLTDILFGGSIIAILVAAVWSVTRFFPAKPVAKKAK